MCNNMTHIPLYYVPLTHRANQRLRRVYKKLPKEGWTHQEMIDNSGFDMNQMLMKPLMRQISVIFDTQTKRWRHDKKVVKMNNRKREKLKRECTIAGADLHRSLRAGKVRFPKPQGSLA